MNGLRFAGGRELKGRYEVESKAHEVYEVVPRKRFPVNMRVNEPEAAETPRRSTKTPDVRQHQPMGIADDHVVDVARTVNKYTYLATCFAARFSESSVEFRRSNVRRGDPAAKEAFEGFDRGRRETGGIAVERNRGPVATDAIYTGRRRLGRRGRCLERPTGASRNAQGFGVFVHLERAAGMPQFHWGLVIFG
jgi:hypothetical protein